MSGVSLGTHGDLERKTSWAAIAAVVASGVVAALQVGKAIIALPALRNDLGLNLAQAGWVMAVFTLLGVIGGIPAGIAANRFGDRRLLLSGIGLLALASAAGAAANSLAVLLGTRVLEGVGFLLITIAAPAILQRLATPNDHDLVFSIWSVFMPVGIAAALLAGPTLQGGWRGVWLANAALASVVAVLVYFLVQRDERGAEDLSWRAMTSDSATVLTARGPVLLAFAFASYTLQYFAVISFLPILLMERMSVSVVMAGVLSAVVVGINIFGNLAAGVLLTRGVASWKLIAIASAVMGLAGIGIFLPATPALVVFALCIFFSLTGGLLPATVLAAASTHAPSPRHTSMSVGLVMQGNNLGQVVGPAAVGGLVAASGWTAAALPVSMAAAVGVVLAFALGRDRAVTSEK